MPQLAPEFVVRLAPEAVVVGSSVFRGLLLLLLHHHHRRHLCFPVEGAIAVRFLRSYFPRDVGMRVVLRW
jgi:hypothetical protein